MREYHEEGRKKRKRGRYFQKQIIKHLKIPITEKYACTASIWIPKTPEHNLKPTINLVLSHSDSKVRFCFNSVHDMLGAVTALRGFVLDNSFIVHEAYLTALQAFLSFHEMKRRYDNNDGTVIQDISRTKYAREREFVNTTNGEIIRA